jgi:uncharacterized protein YceK
MNTQQICSKVYVVVFCVFASFGLGACQLTAKAWSGSWTEERATSSGRVASVEVDGENLKSFDVVVDNRHYHFEASEMLPIAKANNNDVVRRWKTTEVNSSKVVSKAYSECVIPEWNGRATFTWVGPDKYGQLDLWRDSQSSDAESQPNKERFVGYAITKLRPKTKATRHGLPKFVLIALTPFTVVFDTLFLPIYILTAPAWLSHCGGNFWG